MSILQLCFDGNLAALKKSVQNGDKPQTIDRDFKRTALMWAIIRKQRHIVDYLLSLNLELSFDRKDKDGLTALDHAKQCGDSHILDMMQAFHLHQQFPVFKSSDKARLGCSWQQVRTKLNKVGEKEIVAANKKNSIEPITSETLHLTLTHQSHRDKSKKWEFHVGETHHQLRTDVMSFNNVKGNIIAVDIAFKIKVGEDKIRKTITFPLKVPGVKLFTISDADRLIKNHNEDHDAYARLKYLYNLGREIKGVANSHGRDMKYDGSNMDVQCAHHSEQALAAYLSTPSAATMLVSRLRTEMRSQNIGDLGEQVKVDSVILLIHSNRTTCGPCETVVLGLQNEKTDNPEERGEYFGFVEQLETALLKDNSVYEFQLPQRKHEGKEPGLRCMITFSADALDNSTHRTNTASTKTKWNDVNPDTVDIQAIKSSKIQVALFNANNAFHAGATKTTVSDRTIFTSASDVNPATKQKVVKHGQMSDKEQENLCESFDRLYRC